MKVVISMMSAIILVIVMLILTGCESFSFGTEYRDRVVDRVSEAWCEMTDEEKVVTAERREYSEGFVEYLEARCEE